MNAVTLGQVWRVAAVFGSVLIVAGCQPPPQPLSVDPRVSVRPDAGVVVANPLAVSTTPTGITDVSIELQNRTPRDLAVNCTVDWFDAQGHPAGGLSAVPTRVAVGAYAADFCRTVSPSPAARAFRVAITPVM